MEDQQVRKACPMLLWHQSHEISLNCIGGWRCGQSQTLRHPLYMRIHGNTLGPVQGVTKDDIGCFAPYSWKLNQRLERMRYLASMKP
jgi:hypothetical protein